MFQSLYRGLEFRFSPSFVADGCGYSFDEVVERVFEGLDQAKRLISTPFEVCKVV